MRLLRSCSPVLSHWLVYHVLTAIWLENSHASMHFPSMHSHLYCGRFSLHFVIFYFLSSSNAKCWFWSFIWSYSLFAVVSFNNCNFFRWLSNSDVRYCYERHSQWRYMMAWMWLHESQDENKIWVNLQELYGK